MAHLRRDRLVLVPIPVGPNFRFARAAFDEYLDLLHYAGSCRRVGRCMRLLIVEAGKWVGGIVIGSTFPNIDVRDSALGLKPYVCGYKARNLRSPWARENWEYWNRLQKIVNHARTFVFPKHQGRGLGVRSHRILLTQGRMLWEERYDEKVAAFDTLCDAKDSSLFLLNGWSYVGRTAGFESDPSQKLASSGNNPLMRNNVGLKRGRRQWEVWIRTIDATLLNNKRIPRNQ